MAHVTVSLAFADHFLHRSLFFDAILCGVMVMQFSHWLSFSKNERVFTRVIVVRLPRSLRTVGSDLSADPTSVHHAAPGYRC